MHGHTWLINYEINENHYTMGYYLAYGIYSQYATLVKSFQNRITKEQKVFSKAQESCRKDVERAFRILQSRFAFNQERAKLWNQLALSIVIQCCIILHNTIVEDERHATYWDFEYEQIVHVAKVEQ